MGKKISKKNKRFYNDIDKEYKRLEKTPVKCLGLWLLGSRQLCKQVLQVTFGHGKSF